MGKAFDPRMRTPHCPLWSHQAQVPHAPQSRLGYSRRLAVELRTSAGVMSRFATRGVVWAGADDETRTRDIDVGSSVALCATTGRSGADDEIRTRDIDLGKVALYQLSYIRMPSVDGSECYRSRATGSLRRGAGCFAETVSPEERPVIRRCTHGTRNSRVHCAFAAQVSRRPRTGSGSSVDGRDRVRRRRARRARRGRCGVAEGVEVHPVGVHRRGDLDVAHPPHVDEGDVVPVGDLAHPLVEDRHPARASVRRCRGAGVVDGEHHDARAAWRPGARPRRRTPLRGRRCRPAAGARRCRRRGRDQVGLQRDRRARPARRGSARACGRGSRGWRSRSRRSASRAPRRRGRPSRAVRWGARGRGRRRPR